MSHFRSLQLVEEMNESVENLHSARFNRAATQNRDQKTGESMIAGKLVRRDQEEEEGVDSPLTNHDELFQADDSMYDAKEDLTLNIMVN